MVVTLYGVINLFEAWNLSSEKAKEENSRKSVANTKTPRYGQMRQYILLSMEANKCVNYEIFITCGTF